MRDCRSKWKFRCWFRRLVTKIVTCFCPKTAHGKMSFPNVILNNVRKGYSFLSVAMHKCKFARIAVTRVNVSYLAGNSSLRKILQHKWHFKASHWDPSKLTHFIRYFDNDKSLSFIHFTGNQFTGTPMTRFKVPFTLQIFYDWLFG